MVVVPIALVFVLWWKQSQTPATLGLAAGAFVRSLQQWRVLWIIVSAAFLFLGSNILWHRYILMRGGMYFVWCTVQQLLFQSVIGAVLRERLPNRWLGAGLAGLLFATLHLPNPVLVPATFFWGAFCYRVFEGCRSVFALALLQVMLSSMLLWETPYDLNRGFRTGPSYDLAAAGVGRR